jgi:hypothetical protein
MNIAFKLLRCLSSSRPNPASAPWISIVREPGCRKGCFLRPESPVPPCERRNGVGRTRPGVIQLCGYSINTSIIGDLVGNTAYQDDLNILTSLRRISGALAVMDRKPYAKLSERLEVYAAKFKESKRDGLTDRGGAGVWRLFPCRARHQALRRDSLFLLQRRRRPCRRSHPCASDDGSVALPFVRCEQSRLDSPTSG